MATKTYYDTTNQTSTVLDSDIIVVQHDNGGQYSSDLNQMMKTTVSAIRNGAQANVLEGISFRGSGEGSYSDLEINDKKAILDLSNYVLNSRTINNHALTENIELKGDDVKLSSAYVVPVSESQPAINDSIDTAVGKLQSEINAKTDAISEIIETIDSLVSSGLIYKGEVNDISDLPAASASNSGWEYWVVNENSFYVSDGTNWTSVGTQVVDDLTSTDTHKALSANQGRLLNENKAEIDGYYEDMSVGSAEQLISNITEDDSTPYSFRTAGGVVEIGDREDLVHLTGGSLAWNQLVRNGDFSVSSGTTYWSATGGSMVISNNECELTIDTPTQSNRNCLNTSNNIDIIQGHKYFFSYEVKTPYAQNANIAGYSSVDSKSTFNITTIGTTIANTWTREQAIVSALNSGRSSSIRLGVEKTDASAIGDKYYFRDVNIIDLTLMFGSTIADSLYNGTRSPLPEGAIKNPVAWFRRYFPKPYYAYHANSLESVKPYSHVMTGLNQFNPATGTARILGLTQTSNARYQITGTYSSLAFSDLSGNPITVTVDADGYFSTDNECILTVTGGNDTDTCVHLVWDGEMDGEWAKYVANTYGFDTSLELRGIPKLIDVEGTQVKALGFDGDEYYSDGTVKRKYDIVDLGTLTWSYTSSFFFSPFPGKRSKSQGSSIGTLCSSYVADEPQNLPPSDMHIREYGGNVYLRNSSKNASDLVNRTGTGNAAWLDGVYAVYELSNSAQTTESAQPYTNPQIVSNWGTEEFVDGGVVVGTRDFSMSTGHFTKYMTNLKAKVEAAPNAPEENGDYVVRHSADGTNSYVGLRETDLPQADGNYPGMTVGNAEQLLSSVNINDQAIYTDRTAGGGEDIGNKSWLKSVTGVTVNWNQLANIADGSFSTQGNAVSNKNFTYDSSHVYYLRAEVSFAETPTGTPVMFGFFNTANTAYRRKEFPFQSDGVYTQIARGTAGSGAWNGTLPSGSEAHVVLQLFGGSGNLKTYKNVQVYDLTILLGEDIADKLANYTTPSCVKWLENFILKKRKYPYSAPTLQSVCVSSHENTGFNQFDYDTGTARILANIEYRIKGTYSSLSFADLNGNALSITPDSDGLFTSTVECVLTVTGGDDSSTCVYIHWDDSRDGEHEPFKKYSYPMDSSVELRGIPKLDANNKLYYDGDEYGSDGTVTRKYKIVDMGTLSWSWSSDWSRFSVSLLDYTATNTYQQNPKPFISENYIPVKYGDSYLYPKAIISWVGGGEHIVYLKDSTFTRNEGETDAQYADRFKTYVTGQHLVYQLTTPTTESADPFTEEQVVDNWGTEAFTDGLTRDVFVPPMANAEYTQNLRDKLEASPSTPDADGLYLMKRENGQNTYVAYTDPVPALQEDIQDGTVVAKKAECDDEGNSIKTTYATKAEMVNADNNLQQQINKIVGKKVYGIHINGALSDPDSMFTYLEDAVGMTPAHMDFVNDTFDYGSWENAFFMPKPCMLKYDGTVDYYLDPNDYSKKEDGTASDVADDTYAGNAMMEWPKIWLKIVPDSDPKSASVYIANYKADDDFHCWSNINSKDAEVDHFYTPIYNGSIVSSKLRSISGKDYSSLCQDKTAQQEIDLAHANNPSTDILWETELFADIQLVQWLLVLISKSSDSASKFGEGRRAQAPAASSMLGTGTMDSKGLFWGSNTTTYGVKVFGMENFWGNQWRRYEGHVMVNGVQKVKLTYGQEDGSSTNGYNTTGNGYLTADETAPSGASGGYLSQMKFKSKGAVPQVASGSSSTYYCDGLWFNNIGTMVALRGGAATYDAKVGLFYCHLSSPPSLANWYFGASVSYKPLAR